LNRQVAKTPRKEISARYFVRPTAGREHLDEFFLETERPSPRRTLAATGKIKSLLAWRLGALVV
jgi:hypothetical protein